jgi:acylphosphatase
LEEIALRIKVYGKVQGVFYRKTTAEKAGSLSLLGWVKNNPDGSVEIEVQGPQPNVAELVDWCKKGPKNAMVTKVEEFPLPLGPYSNFRIIR